MKKEISYRSRRDRARRGMFFLVIGVVFSGICIYMLVTGLLSEAAPVFGGLAIGLSILGVVLRKGSGGEVRCLPDSVLIGERTIPREVITGLRIHEHITGSSGEQSSTWTIMLGTTDGEVEIYEGYGRRSAVLLSRKISFVLSLPRVE